jgi:chromosome segregation ATPase
LIAAMLSTYASPVWFAQHEHLEKSKIELESELSELRASHETLTKELEQFREQYELLKREKARHWNEIVEAQLSANLLIEVRLAVLSLCKLLGC